MSRITEIEKIFNLATLHSWCTQVNELITEFNNKYKDDNLVIKFLTKKLKEKNIPREHFILSIVLLNYQNYPTLDIIELAITSLYRKINKNDIVFFKEHLFNGSLPLSSDLSEDITNRSFLSPKMAIKKAMKIDSLVSRKNPIFTVLYLNFILSRIDMNEENRAMVAFLLLRLDVELPKSLKERVFKYLQEYKDIIKELLEEEFGQGVNIDEIEKIKVKPDKNSISTTPLENKVNIHSNKILDTLSPWIYKNLKIKNKIISLIKINQDNKNYSEKFKKVNESNLIDKLNNLFVKKEKNNKTDNHKNKDFETDLTPRSENENSDSKVTKKTDDKEKNIRSKNEKLDKNSSDSTTIKPEKNWQIGLKQNRQILESLLAGLEKTSIKILIPKKRKNNLRGKNQQQDLLSKIKNIRVPIGIIAFFLLLIPVLFVIRDKTVNNLPGTYKQDSKELENLSESDNSILEDKVGSNSELTNNETPRFETELENTDLIKTENLIPKDFPMNITIVENQIIWKVNDGDSINGFFNALQDFKPKLEKTKLEKISNLDWETFFEVFKSNNNLRTSYHIIYPTETFVLPLE